MLLVMEMCSKNNLVVIAVTCMHQFARSEMPEAAEFTVIVISIVYTIFSFITLY
jgi:hypothetical protein